MLNDPNEIVQCPICQKLKCDMKGHIFTSTTVTPADQEWAEFLRWIMEKK